MVVILQLFRTTFLTAPLIHYAAIRVESMQPEDRFLRYNKRDMKSLQAASFATKRRQVCLSILIIISKNNILLEILQFLLLINI